MVDRNPTVSINLFILKLFLSWSGLEPVSLDRKAKNLSLRLELCNDLFPVGRTLTT